MLSAGSRNRRIRIEAPPTTKHATLGSQTGNWTTFWEGWAEIIDEDPTRGMETDVRGLRNARRPATVNILWVAGVTSRMQIVYLDRGNRRMKILAPPAEIGHREGLAIAVADFATAGDG